MKKFFVVLLIVIMLLCPLTAFAEQSELAYWDKTGDAVFCVSWTNSRPTVTFIDEGGTVYDPMIETDYTFTILYDKEMYYVVENAPQGRWYVSYDKKDNTSIKVSMFPYVQDLSVTNFVVGNISGNYTDVSFVVEHEHDNVSYSYRISAVTSKMGEEKVLESGKGYTNSEVYERVYLDSLATYSGYMLKLYVWYTVDDTDVFDFAFSVPFSYTNTSVDVAMADYALTVNTDQQLVDVYWPDIDYNAQPVLVALFEDDAAEPSLFFEADADADTMQLSYDPAAQRIRVDLSVKKDDVSAKTISKSLDLSDIKIALDEADVSNSTQYYFRYKGFANQRVDVICNSETVGLVLSGDGQCAVKLLDDWNSLEVRYTDADNVTWVFSREIFVDRIPPILSVAEPYDGMTTDKASIQISGNAKDCVSVTINGSAVQLGASGTFMQEISLTAGENIITIVAADMAGNETLYTAVVSNTSGQPANADVSGADDTDIQVGAFDLIGIFKKPGSFAMLIIVSAVCALVVVYALVFWKKGKGGKANEKQ